MADNTISGQLGFAIDGPAAIYVGNQNCEATKYITHPAEEAGLLGLTDGGVTISYQTMTHRINGDEYGGSEGMPAELLILGGQATIQATLVKWSGLTTDMYVMNGWNASVDAGAVPPIGSAYFGNDYGFSFWVVGMNAGTGYYFPKCELATQAKQWNISSLERRLQISVQAYSVYNKWTETINNETVNRSTADTFFMGADTVNLANADCAAFFV